jgi:MOSC domain-containing protein YiiM
MRQGVVVAIHIAQEAAGPMVAVPEARAIPGQGLEGDRYFRNVGTYSARPGTGRQLTLIEVETLEALNREAGITLSSGASRRNIATRGVALNHLVGKQFQVGGVLLEGVRLCEPCAHLEGLTQQGVLSGLVHRGGLRANILTEGTIRLGEAVWPVSASGGFSPGQ